MDISFIMHDPNLKLRMCVKNIVVEGTVSHIFDRDPDSFLIKFRKKKFNNTKKKSYPFFDIK